MINRMPLAKGVDPGLSRCPDFTAVLNEKSTGQYQMTATIRLRQAQALVSGLTEYAKKRRAFSLGNFLGISRAFCLWAAFTLAFSSDGGVGLTQENRQLETEPTIVLTSEERVWLRDHPDIQLGYTDTLEPEVIVNSDGTYSGMVVDFLDALNEKLGTEIGLRVYSIPELLDKAKNKRIDGILNLHPEYADDLGLLKTQTYWPAYPAVFARKETSFKSPDDFADKRVAIIDKVYITQKLMDRYGKQATILKVEDALGGLQSVEKGEADLFLGFSYNSFFIPKYQLFDVVPAHVFIDSPEWFGIGIRADWPELVSILNKGISGFSEEEIHAIITKWSYLPEKQDTIELTDEERDWIDQNHKVRVRVSEQAPYMYSEDGAPIGIIVDLLDTISERTGIKFHFVIPSPSFHVDLQGLIQHTGPDLLGSLTPTHERGKKILFTKPYISSPKFIFTRDDAEFVASMENLTGKTVAVIKAYLVHKELEKNYPNIDLVFCKNNREALTAVSSGKAFAFIGSIMATPFMINEYGLRNLKASCPSALQDATVAMAIRNDWPELRDIINKVLGDMSGSEKAAIINKWSSVKVEYGIRPGDVVEWILLVAGAASIIVILFVFWNRALAKKVRERTYELESSNKSLAVEVAQRTEAEKLLRDSRDYLKNLTDSLPDAVFSVKLPERKIEWANDTFKVLGYKPDECVGRSTEFLYPSEKDYLAFGDKMARAIAEGKEVLHLEQTLRNKSGDHFPADITVSLFRTNGIVVSETAIVRNIAERKQREQQLQEYQVRLKALASQLTLAEEKERRRIAADLHDHVGHSLALARMQLDGIPEAKSALEQKILVKDVSNILLNALQDTRGLIFELSSPSMNEIGLSAAISEWLEEQIAKRQGLETEFVDNIRDERRKTLDENVRALIFRNVRELLTNVIKHARANKVRVHLTEEANRLQIVVEDDGIGFAHSVENIKQKQTGGFGLFSIQERMADLGGSFDIQSEPGKGCKVALTVPLGDGSS